MSSSGRRIPSAPGLSGEQLPIPQVTGTVHEVDVDQLFFSTTDTRGVIHHSNSVFIELSRYRRDEFSGAPHNIICHPGMSGSVFKAIWDTLEAGSLFAAYMRNLAADGNEYDIFATVTPLSDGGYFSMCARPVCSDLFDTAHAIYCDTRAAESQAIGGRANCRAAAKEGLDRVTEMLAGASPSPYEEFRSTTLPAEAVRREELFDGIPMRPDTAGDLCIMSGLVARVAAGFDPWMSGQQQLAELSISFRATGRRLAWTLKDLRLSVGRIAALDRPGPRAESLADLLDLQTQTQVLASPFVARLVDTPTQLDTNGARTRFHIALARLHATIISLSTVEFINGVGDLQYSAQAIPDLIESLREDIAEVERQAQAHRALVAQVVTYIDEASRMMAIPNQLLMLWTSSAASSDPELLTIATEFSSATSDVVESVGCRLAGLDDSAARCQATHVADSLAELGEALSSFTTAAGAVIPG